jgi:hypothetical protein
MACILILPIDFSPAARSVFFPRRRRTVIYPDVSVSVPPGCPKADTDTEFFEPFEKQVAKSEPGKLKGQLFQHSGLNQNDRAEDLHYGLAYEFGTDSPYSAQSRLSRENGGISIAYLWCDLTVLPLFAAVSGNALSFGLRTCGGFRPWCQHERRVARKHEAG